MVLLLFKELCNTFAKFMILCSIGSVLLSIIIDALLVTTYKIALNSIILCYLHILVYVSASNDEEKSATCVIAFLVNLMHSNYKSIEVREETKQRFFT